MQARECNNVCKKRITWIVPDERLEVLHWRVLLRARRVRDERATRRAPPPHRDKRLLHAEIFIHTVSYISTRICRHHVLHKTSDGLSLRACKYLSMVILIKRMRWAVSRLPVSYTSPVTLVGVVK